MRIFRKTDRIVTLWQNNWCSILIPLIAVIVGCSLIAIFGEETKLSCYRATPQLGQCQFDRNYFLSQQRQSIPLDTIQKVDIEASNSDDEDPATRIVLITKNGTIPVSLNGNYEERDPLAAQLASFLATPTATAFKLTDGGLLFSYFVAGCTGLTCLIYLLSGSLTIVRFNKDREDCQIDTWRLWGKQTIHCALSNINKIAVEEPNSKALRLAIERKDGEVWPFNKKFLSAAHHKRERKISREINEFLEINAPNPEVF